MGAIASQITSLTIVYSTVYWGRSNKTSKLRVTSLCVGNSPGTGEFPAQMASNAENFSIWWRHHVSWGILYWNLEATSIKPISYNTPHWNRNEHMSVPMCRFVGYGTYRCIMGFLRYDNSTRSIPSSSLRLLRASIQGKQSIDVRANNQVTRYCSLETSMIKLLEHQHRPQHATLWNTMHWDPRSKMAEIMQTTFLNAFSSMKNFEFR